ncbi:MAG: threonine/serine exporter family protein [Erysipelotrichaceae bacterium]|nr:threonine/serine exporter family protein [Erysipelotrichaceae bacterium]
MSIRILGALLASLGFGVLFNLKQHKLFFACLGGGIGAFIHEWTMYLGFSSVLSLLVASMVIAMYSELMARKLKTPVTSFMLVALILLVPGGGMYYTMLEVILNRTDNAIIIGVDTLAKAGALALGTFVSTTIRKLLFFRGHQ